MKMLKGKQTNKTTVFEGYGTFRTGTYITVRKNILSRKELPDRKVHYPKCLPAT